MNDRTSHKDISRRGFLTVTGLGMLGCAQRATTRRTTDVPGERRPNIILIVSDDQGYADSGCYGGIDIPTPHIDSLARDGVRCTDGYVSCPVCSPTRAGLMTGRYQQRFGWETNPGPGHEQKPELGMSLDELTIADVMRDAGYQTGIVGKWHLGAGPKFHPSERGFDEFYGFLGGWNNYFLENRRFPVYRNQTEVTDYEYLTHAFAREAVDYIRRHSDEPFFLYLAYNAVHLPMEAPAEYIDRFAHIENPQRGTYAAMLSAMDDGIGEVRKALRDEGLEENTLVFFMSDNGGAARNSSDNRPLHGHKGQVYDGGIRVPFLVCWPGVIPAGRTYSRPVIALDVLPTAAAAGGARVPDDRVIDGVNLLPFLDGDAGTPHDYLFWRHRRGRASRHGNWKIVIPDEGVPELYDLASDIGEEKNLSDERPEILHDMLGALEKWESEMMEPPSPAPRRR
jgi:arylsulfatase A-like enzyme